ncbi:hypothetical protein [Zhihengliuella alba]|uniref:hypothetical protein n=1 Tax=Zhihengliuella alba TaxID=547018 RepID=UPI0031EBE6C2
MKDKETKHEFDVLETDWRIDAGLFELIKSDRYPAAQQPRRPKHHVVAKSAAPKKEA